MRRKRKWPLQRLIYPGGGKLKIKNVITGEFPSGSWAGTVKGTIPADGTLFMVRIFTHGDMSLTTEYLTVGNQSVQIWSTEVGGHQFSDMGWWTYAFQPCKVKKGDEFALSRQGIGSSVTRNGLYIGIIV